MLDEELLKQREAIDQLETSSHYH